MKKLMLIANPYSGKGQVKLNLFDVIQVFSQADYSVTVYMPDQEKGHSIISLAQEYAKDYDILVCMGGDGTLSDTATGLMLSGAKVPLGYIPLGSTNDMANSLALPKASAAAAKTIVEGTPIPYDMGYYDGKYFTYIAAFGAFTAVSYMTPQNLKKAFGHSAYIFEGLSELEDIAPVHTTVEYDDGVIEGDFIFGSVSNSTSVGGIVKLDKTMVSLNDGLFEVFLIREPTSAMDLGNILSDFVTKNFVSDKVIMLHTKKVRFQFSYPTAWTRDGESGGLYMDVTMENIHNAVQFLRTED